MRFLSALLSTVVACCPVYAVDIKLPDKVTGDVSDFVVIKAVTTGQTVKWFTFDTGLRLFPPDLLRDTKTAVVWSSVAGTYHLAAYTGDASGPSDPAVTVIVLGTPTPPTPPVPTDSLFRSLQSAYTADTDPAKARQRDDLAELYAMAPVNDPKITTIGDLLRTLKAARLLLMPDTAFLAERQVTATYLNTVLPTQPDAALDSGTRAMIQREFNKLAQYLKGVK